jgi:hypothetical protein
VSIEKSASKRGVASGQSAASSEACSVVKMPGKPGPRGSRAGNCGGEGHGRHLGTWSGCPGTLRRRGRGMVRRLSWELERPSSVPACGDGSVPVYNRKREVAGCREGVGGGRSTADWGGDVQGVTEHMHRPGKPGGLSPSDLPAKLNQWPTSPGGRRRSSRTPTTVVQTRPIGSRETRTAESLRIPGRFT